MAMGMLRKADGKSKCSFRGCKRVKPGSKYLLVRGWSMNLATGKWRCPKHQD